MRDHARAVVVGGVGGCPILNWLTRLGWEDVVGYDKAVRGADGVLRARLSRS